MSLTGHFYTTQTTVLAVLLLATLPMVVNNVLSQTALSVGAVAAWVWSDVVLAVSLAVVAVILVPRDGAIGLGLAYVVGYIATCLVLVKPVHSRLAAMRLEAV
jgi:O-antigen/teichoic acid export membrane protein